MLNENLPPVVTHASVGTDFLEPLQVITELTVQVRGGELVEFTINTIFLPIEEPVRNLVLPWIGHNGDNFFDL